MSQYDEDHHRYYDEPENRDDDECYTCTLYLAHGTAKALGFRRTQRESIEATAKDLVWLPKSQIEWEANEPSHAWRWQPMTVTMPLWLARKHKLCPDHT